MRLILFMYIQKELTNKQRLKSTNKRDGYLNTTDLYRFLMLQKILLKSTCVSSTLKRLLSGSFPSCYLF